MELAPALIALIGVLIGSYIAHSLSVRRERENRIASLKVAELNLRREKLEELYALLARWDLSMSSVSITWMMCMQGKFSYNDALDQITTSQRKDIDFFRTDMLIDVYFPEGRKSYDSLMDHRTRVNRLQADFRRFYLQAGEGSLYPYLQRYVEASEELEKHALLVKNEVVSQLRQTTPSTLLPVEALRR